MLLIIPLQPTTMGADGDETSIVYLDGRYLTGYDRPNSIRYINLWYFSLFRADQSGNYVNFNFTHNTLVTLFINNKPQLLHGPITVYLGLTEPETFLMLWLPTFSLNGIGRAKIFGVCGTIQITAAV